LIHLVKSFHQHSEIPNYDISGGLAFLVKAKVPSAH
jgi:hypothetical protein